MRTKWLGLVLPVPLRTATALIEKHRFRRGSASGFDIIEVQHQSVRGRFIEEAIVQEVVEDPFGAKQTTEIRRFNIVNFVIVVFDEQTLVLRVEEPGRSIKRFLQMLHGSIGFGTVIKPTILDIENVLASLRQYLDAATIKIDKVKASGVVLSRTASARVEVLSSQDALADFRAAFAGSLVNIERVAGSIIIDGDVSTLEITRTGMVTCAPELLDVFTGVLGPIVKSNP